MIWRFVREFPSTTEQPAARRVADIFVRVSFAVGVALFTINAVGWLGPSATPSWFMALYALLEREQPEGSYWPLLFMIGRPQFLFSCGRHDARRTKTDAA